MFNWKFIKTPNLICRVTVHKLFENNFSGHRIVFFLSLFNASLYKNINWMIFIDLWNLSNKLEVHVRFSSRFVICWRMRRRMKMLPLFLSVGILTLQPSVRIQIWKTHGLVRFVENEEKNENAEFRVKEVEYIQVEVGPF